MLDVLHRNNSRLRFQFRGPVKAGAAARRSCTCPGLSTSLWWEARCSPTGLFFSERDGPLRIARETTEADMFINPMMLPFILYRHWLENVVLPFLDNLEGNSKSVIKEATDMQSAVIDKTKKVAAYEG
jgi:hypothetical protein